VSRRSLPIFWSPLAVEDLRSITAFIRQHRLEAARRIRQEIRSATRRFGRFPLSGRTLPEAPTGPLREIIVRDYRVIYAPGPDRVEILAAIHGARDVGGGPE
jgi:plasmid stabilization system protein ParE